VKLLIDMNLSPTWVEFLRLAGVEAAHWSDIGPANAPDTDVMAWARDRDFVVFTNDLDFSALLAMTRGTGPSVLQLRLQDLLPGGAGPVVLQVLREHAERLAAGAILTVAASGTRVRVLPLHEDGT
jgi:predicted nuclease of predicted toxin-antitoxin system